MEDEQVETEWVEGACLLGVVREGRGEEKQGIDQRGGEAGVPQMLRWRGGRKRIRVRLATIIARIVLLGRCAWLLVSPLLVRSPRAKI